MGESRDLHGLHRTGRRGISCGTFTGHGPAFQVIFLPVDGSRRDVIGGVRALRVALLRLGARFARSWQA